MTWFRRPDPAAPGRPRAARHVVRAGAPAARAAGLVVVAVLTGPFLSASASSAAPPPAAALSAPAAAPLPAAAALSAPVFVAATKPAATPAGVTFGLRPAGRKAVDARTTWTYRNVKPGQTWIDYLAVENFSERPATFTVYPSDAYNNSGGGFDLHRREDKQRGVGSWIQLATTRVTVPARQTMIMPFRFSVPRKVEPGDHGGGIVASFRTTRIDAKGNTVAVDSRVGSRMYVRIAGKLSPRIVVERTSATWLPTGFPRGAASVTWIVHNTGNVRLEGTQSVRVRGLLGSGTSARDLPELPELLPGGSATFSTRVDGLWPLLLHTAYVVVDPRSVTGNVDPALAQASARVRFWSSVWLWVALALLLAAGGAWWWRSRRRGRRPTPMPTGPTPTGPTPPGPTPPGTTPPGRVTVPAALALAVALLAWPAGAPRASAAGDELTFLPAKGLDVDPMYAVTSGPCPQSSTGVLARMYGAGLPADGAIVVANTQAGVRTDTAFGVPLQDSLYGLAQTLNVTFKGRYQVVLSCIDELGVRTFATFKGTLTFPKPHRFVGKAPSKPPAHGVPIGYMTSTFPQLRDSAAPGGPGGAAGRAPAPGGDAAGAPSAKPGAPAPGDPGQPPQAVAAPGARTASAAGDGGSRLPFLVVGGALLLGAAAVWMWGRRPEPDRPPVDWGDDGPGPRPSGSGAGSGVGRSAEAGAERVGGVRR